MRGVKVARVFSTIAFRSTAGRLKLAAGGIGPGQGQDVFDQLRQPQGFVLQQGEGFRLPGAARRR
jgi:hypothetical protein